MKKNKKGKTLALACTFALIAGLAATFAWFTSTDDKTNHFEGAAAAGKDIEIVETFTPPKDWEPGAEVNKDVSIANIGENDVIIRVSFEESLKLLADYKPKEATGDTDLNNKTKDDVYILTGTNPDSAYNTTSKFNGAAPSYTITGGDYDGKYTLVVKEKSSSNNGVTTYSYRSYFQREGTTEIYYASGIQEITRDASGNITVVGSPTLSYIDLTYGAETKADWRGGSHNPNLTLVSGTNYTGTLKVDKVIQILFNNVSPAPTAGSWYFNQTDGYFYFIKVVGSGETTEQLVDSVTLLGTADNEYSKLQYDLIVHAEGISAFKEAVDTWVPAGTNAALSATLKGITK